MDLTFTGKLVKATNGNWYYVSKGRPTKTFTEKIAQTTDGKWYYCTDGRPDLKFSGKIALCTNGNWYYVTNGKAVPIKWTKESEKGITHFYTLDGEEITLNKGKTYVGLIPDDYWDEVKLN